MQGLGTHVNCQALSLSATHWLQFAVMLAGWLPGLIAAVIVFQAVYRRLRATTRNENQVAIAATGALLAAGAGYFLVWMAVTWLLRGFICPA